MIEDSTALSFTQRASVKGMGPLTHETSQGFLAHTCLATHITRWDDENEPEVMLAGVFGQACWARERPQGTRKERKKTQRAQKRAGDPGESARWARAMANAGPMPAGVRWTLVADRECDIFGVLLACCAGNHDWVIRAARPRRTTSASGDVFATAATAPVLGRFDLKLRARPGVAARQAHLEVRAVTTGIVAPRDLPGQHAPQASQLVEVRELDPPPDVPALHWVLLTSWPCDTFAQARRVVGAYATRWLVEEYHKVLKAGTHIEDSQLSRCERIQALLAIHAVVAVDLLQLKLLAKAYPDQPVARDLLAPQALDILEAKFGRPDKGWTNATALHCVARMGGYLGRKHDGPPGWLSIWRGWLRLTLMVEGYLFALGQKTCGQ